MMAIISLPPDPFEDTEQEQTHKNMEQLLKTGFWGKRASGCLPYAVDTQRFLFAYRSHLVEDALTWAIWGGATDAGETSESGAKREFLEESDYTGKILKLVPLFTKSFQVGFKFSSFLAVIPKQFNPQLDWETTNYRWVSYGRWPNPLHPGVKIMLQNSGVQTLIQKEMQEWLSKT